eukprot:1160396-Pelagomonas_calceolata.AAC.3
MQAAAKLAAAHSKAGPHPHPLPSSSPISLPAVPSPHPDPQHPAPHQQQHPHLSHPQHKDHAHGWMDGPRAFSPPAAETWRHSTELPGSHCACIAFHGAGMHQVQPMCLFAPLAQESIVFVMPVFACIPGQCAAKVLVCFTRQEA